MKQIPGVTLKALSELPDHLRANLEASGEALAQTLDAFNAAHAYVLDEATLRARERARRYREANADDLKEMAKRRRLRERLEYAIAKRALFDQIPPPEDESPAERNLREWNASHRGTLDQALAEEYEWLRKRKEARAAKREAARPTPPPRQYVSQELHAQQARERARRYRERNREALAQKARERRAAAKLAELLA